MKTLTVLFSFFVLTACQDQQSDLAALEHNEWLPGGETTNTLLLGANAFSRPVSNITDENRMSFFSGNSFFNQPWVSAPASTTKRDGLGPIFNANSCAACHHKDGRGRPPTISEETFLGLLLRLDPNDISHTLGGQVQPHAVNGVPVEGIPRVSYKTVEGSYPDGTTYSLFKPTYSVSGINHAISISPRVAPAVMGVGLLEAISAERIIALSDENDADNDGISGKINWLKSKTAVNHVIGRMGWKAEQPDVLLQSASAFNGDIGITSSLFPNNHCTDTQIKCKSALNGGEPEIDDETLLKVATYSRLLAVPKRQEFDSNEILRGKKQFTDLGCDSCHTPAHITSKIYQLKELQDQKIWPYTDLLLHDMGEGLADQNGTNKLSREWRTPPLWGISYYQQVNNHTRLLHDGRARNIEEAILWHGGEAENIKNKFKSLNHSQRSELIQFVGSL